MQDFWEFIKDNSGTVVTLSTIVGGTIAFFRLKSKKHKDKKTKEVVDVVLKVLENESFVCVRGNMNNKRLEEIIKNLEDMSIRGDSRKAEQILQFKSVQNLQTGVAVLLQQARGDNLNGEVAKTIKALEKDSDDIQEYLFKNLK